MRDGCIKKYLNCLYIEKATEEKYEGNGNEKKAQIFFVGAPIKKHRAQLGKIQRALGAASAL